jgi:hypothetical protein
VGFTLVQEEKYQKKSVKREEEIIIIMMMIIIITTTAMYKMLTGIIVRRISVHLEEHNLLPAELKGCHSGSKGCKDQLMISKAMLEDCKKRRKNLNMAWVDYQKALIVFHITG